METENRIERTIGLVMLAVLAIGCVLTSCKVCKKTNGRNKK